MWHTAKRIMENSSRYIWFNGALTVCVFKCFCNCIKLLLNMQRMSALLAGSITVGRAATVVNHDDTVQQHFLMDSSAKCSRARSSPKVQGKYCADVLHARRLPTLDKVVVYMPSLPPQTGWNFVQRVSQFAHIMHRARHAWAYVCCMCTIDTEYFT